MSDTANSAAAGSRGRAADNPAQIPPPGLKDVVWRISGDITKDRILLTAAGVSFYLLLSLVPTLTAFVSIYGLFYDSANVLDHVDLLRGIVPPGAVEVVNNQLTRLTSENSNTLGWTLLVSLGIALWSASAGVKAMFEAMNVAYHEQEKRNFLQVALVSIMFTLCGAIAAVLVIAVVVIMPMLVKLLPGGGLEWAVRIGSYGAMLVVLSLMIAALYRWGASREEARWRWISPGVVLAVVALGAGSVGLSWYVSNFSDNSATYGTLGAVIGLMTWLWISATVVIIGAVVNSELEHQTRRDTTTGERLPMGERGAYVADTLGEPWPDKDDIEPAPRRERRKMSLGALVLAVPAAMVLLAADRRHRRGE